jgi:alpha-glucosidase
MKNLSRRSLLAYGGAAALARTVGLEAPARAASGPASPLPTPAPPLRFASRNSVFTRQGAGPRYWNIYGYAYPHNAPIPESEWKANIDWLARDLAPSGYDMACTDGWIEGSTRTTENGYILSYNDSWQHDWAYWAKYLAGKGMKLGVYYNPLWVHRAAVEDPSKTVVGRPGIKIADLVAPNDFFAKDFGGNTLYWIDVTRPGAKEYVQGYVRYFKQFGVAFLRIDFLSWYETGLDGTSTPANDPHGRANYETALGWINEAAGEDMEVSLVMPAMLEDGRVEIADGDMARIDRDAFDGGWEWLSGGRQTWQNGWPNWKSPFLGFTGWSHHSGRGQLIMDGDFMRASTFASDEERRTMVNLMVIAGSPLAVADTYQQIGSNSWVYTNKEVLQLNEEGLTGKPLYRSAAPYSVDPGSRDSERWAGQLPDGSWAVALFNRSDTETQTKTIDFSKDLGLSVAANVRDLWAHKDLGVRNDVTASLAPHASAIFRIRPLKVDGTTRYPAAYAAWGGGASFNNNHAGHDGSGFVDGLAARNGAGDSLVTFAVQAPHAGTYTIRYRYANATGATSTMTVSAEKADHSILDGPKRVSFPALATWDTWGVVADTITLTAGENLITIGHGQTDAGAINLNWIELKA